MIFGKWVATTGPGLNYNLPAPIGEVETPMVDFEYPTEVGFASSADGTSVREKADESLMLTGDENIIDIQFVVFWKIRDAGKYLFKVRDPETTVKSVAEAAMREIVGQSKFEAIRTVGRAQIQTQALELIQVILDSYDAGIEVTKLEMQRVDPPQAVIEAFRDVQAARADKERSVNDAQGYFNEITQRAEGNAQQIIKAAEAYRAERIAVATGDAQRFVSVYDQYVKAEDITQRRLYLETMERVMHDMNKVLVETPPGGTVPYLYLNELMQRLPQPHRPTATETPPSDTAGGEAATTTEGASQ
jgi:membrane protease subunit HflK